MNIDQSVPSLKERLNSKIVLKIAVLCGLSVCHLADRCWACAAVNRDAKKARYLTP